MDNKILSLVILILIVAVLTLFLVGWQAGLTGFAVKDSSEENKGSLKTVETSADSASEEEQGGVATTNVIKDSGTSRSSGGSSSGGGNSGGNSGGDSGGSSNNNPSPSPSKPIVFLSLDSYSGNKNDEFLISVKISSAEKIYAAEFLLSFNPDILQVINATAGSFLKQDGANTYEIIKNENGKITFASTRLISQEGVSGTGNLAVISFLAKGKGTSQLFLDNVKITDTSLTTDKFQIDIKNSQVTII